jgi:steroid delta-isomerase-like uncharacterized protein
MKTPREVIEEWVAAFNARDAARAAACYHDEAANWQVAAGPPVVGRVNIQKDFTEFFAAFPDTVTRVENLFEAGEWAMLEWSGGATWRGEFAGLQPNGKTFTLRGCGFFHVIDGKIKYQRGYWDRASWFQQLGIPV